MALNIIRQGPISDGYTLYDSGESVTTVGIDGVNLRNELAGVYYVSPHNVFLILKLSWKILIQESSFLGHRGPRKMTIAVPDIDKEGEPNERAPTCVKWV